MAIIYKVNKNEKKNIMNDRTAVIIFIMFSVVLLIGISLLPKSPVPASVTTAQ